MENSLYSPFGTGFLSPAESSIALKKALSMNREDLIGEIRASGLRGRGGSGFPTGTKWMLVAASDAPEKFIIMNADEGEPGTFKDRILLSDYLYMVLDGLIIAGYAIGARQGVIYLRAEYEFLKNHIEEELSSRMAGSMLGDSVLGRDSFSFNVSIFMGSGAYVCGEETALIESMEGQRGEARSRPPYPSNRGYLGMPTVVNNVETLCMVPKIILKGGDAFRRQGTKGSSGVKLFSVSGDCALPGVYELPWGIRLSELLELCQANNPKAVQVGGASGTCLVPSEFDRCLSYEDVPTGGSVIIFGQGRKMVEVMRCFMEFFVEESCGQCTPCRIGNRKLLEGVISLQEGNYSLSRIEALIGLAKSMQIASKCGLGQTSPNAFLSILEKFEEELFI